jgi:hypothetical protein
MHNAFGLFIAIFAAFWLFLAARWMAKDLKASARAKWIKGTMYLFILIGAGGFFAAALSATGIIMLPTSYEWPAGYVRGVVTAADGKHIVPLMPPGRVQIYDSQWHFIRGWNVDASGGDFKVRCSPDGLIEVFTARGQRHYSFSQDGQPSLRAVSQSRFFRWPSRVKQPSSLLHHCCGSSPAHFSHGLWQWLVLSA